MYLLTCQKCGVSAGGNIMQTILQSEQFFFHAWMETSEEKE